ncbi:MarR family winged helix-turn-helix transcriptional regulator [Luxibacter massiliensis]|uniref:MarR family winged helix-turn-helix transcriptional regulator n=1 Tax=Luxibacter massiliensis TaxID=2219695 RepID=UPI000F04B641|nr:MarR family transcriptional regulator [Luxibacter massiliensis]
MKCDMNHIPTIGIITQITHLSMNQAKMLFGRFDLKAGQAGILFILSHMGELSQRELASQLNVTPSSITTAIQKMEKLDYIKRKPDDNDQRIMRLGLTDRGKACLEDIKAVAEEMDDIIFRGMSQEEKLLLRRMLVQIRDNLDYNMKGREL